MTAKTKLTPEVSAQAASATECAVVIPAYKPSGVLVELVEKLRGQPGIAGVVVVDDGSGTAFEDIFERIRCMDRTMVVRHFVNLGKGAALKTGLNQAACAYPNSPGFVTADADGQHTPEDIVKVAIALQKKSRALVIGARQFDGEVPLRSRFGNTLTRSVMRAVTGQKLTDTQTGLRGIPREFLTSLLRVKSTGYDFELDMLVECKYTHRSITEVPISTIYIDDNKSSHFNPLRDSMRIYFVFVRFAAVSLGSALIDNVTFYAALHFTAKILVAQTVCRIVSGTFNYWANKRSVFHSNARNQIALPKYCLAALLAGSLSYIGIRALVNYVGMQVMPAKLLAEAVMFVFSFVIQRDLIFRQPEPTDDTTS